MYSAITKHGGITFEELLQCNRDLLRETEDMSTADAYQSRSILPTNFLVADAHTGCLVSIAEASSV